MTKKRVLYPERGGRRGRKQETLRTVERATKGDEALPTELKGRTVDSVDEARVGVGLWSIGHDFYYQYEIFGGDDFPGGMVLDFLVHTTSPLPTPISVKAGYWHKGKREAQQVLKESQLSHKLQREMAPLVVIKSEQIPDLATTRVVLLHEIGRA
jgi:hypothetical protein